MIPDILVADLVMLLQALSRALDTDQSETRTGNSCIGYATHVSVLWLLSQISSDSVALVTHMNSVTPMEARSPTSESLS